MLRLKVNLGVTPPLGIPIEYNYHLYLNLRKCLFNFLGEKKPSLIPVYKKKMPNFTVSQLLCPERSIEYGLLQIRSRHVAFYLSTLNQAFAEQMYQALHLSRGISLFQNRLTLQKIEIPEEPEFYSGMHFSMLSPLLLWKKQGKAIYFLRPEDPDLNEVFAANLARRYQRSTGIDLPAAAINIRLNRDYLQQKVNKTKLITIRSIHYKAMLCPFKLEGEKELIRFAYYEGIGEKNPYGFGMIEIAREQTPK